MCLTMHTRSLILFHMKTNTVTVTSAFRTATVPVAVRMPGRSAVRTLAGQAVLSMMYAWGTPGAPAAFAHMKVAAGDSLLYAASAQRL